MHGIFVPVSDKLDPSSFQIANRLDPFLRADLSKHTTTAVERLPRDAMPPLVGHVLGGQGTFGSQSHRMRRRKAHHETQNRRLPIGANGRTVGSSGQTSRHKQVGAR